MARIDGTTQTRFAGLRDILQRRVETGDELGVSLCVLVDGDVAADLWGGYMDYDRTRPWREDTVVPVWSTTKTITSLAVLMLADRGLIDVNDAVSKHWPEFGANGKSEIQIRHILGHTSGVSGIETPITWDEVGDVEKINGLLAGQAPWWPPGTASGYHTMSWGRMLSEVAWRVTGVTLADFIQREITGPLGADYWLGLPETHWGRAAEIVPPTTLPDGVAPEPGSVCAKTMLNPPPNPGRVNGPEWRKAQLAANGITNSRALVRILSAITLGGRTVSGHQLLSKEKVGLIFQEQFQGEDLVLHKALRWGIGFALAGDGSLPDDAWLPSGRVCYWGGWGGSVAIMDLDRRVTLAFTMNKMADVAMANDTARECVKMVYDVLSTAI